MSKDHIKLSSNTESARQAAELYALRRMLAASQGTFSISIAVCNSPALRDYIIETLRSEEDGIYILYLPDDAFDVLDCAENKIENAEYQTLFITNLEASLSSSESTHPILRSLNASRELWKNTFPCPVVFWLPEYAATLLIKEARDFWAWRSHQFDFVSEMVAPLKALSDKASGDLLLASNLSIDEKQFRIAELHQRIEEVGPNPDSVMVHHVRLWLDEIAWLHKLIGNLDKAELVHDQSLEIDSRLNNKAGMAIDYGSIGLIALTRGDLDKAKAMFREALNLYQQLRDKEGIAVCYNNLGLIEDSRGNIDEAEVYFNKSLDIAIQLNHNEGQAIDYGNLGNIAHKRGNYGSAKKLHIKALEIDKQLGNKQGMASDYGNLGLCASAQGDLESAIHFYRKALEIQEQIGDLEGMANQYGNLGLIARELGDLEDSERLFNQVLEINEKLGNQVQIANTFCNLGSLANLRNNVDEARHLWSQARDLFERVDMPHMVKRMQEAINELN